MKSIFRYKPFSFDGHGVNGDDEYKTRLATLSDSVKQSPEAEQIGRILACGPEAIELLLDAQAAIATMLIGRDHGITPQALAAMSKSGLAIDAFFSKVQVKRVRGEDEPTLTSAGRAVLGE